MKKNIKIFNKNGNDFYAPFPKLSPYSYINKKRIKNPKFTFRKTAQYVKKIIKNPKKWLDVGSANGEFVYYLAKKLKNTEFIGTDITSEFVKIAKKLNKDNKNTKFICENIFKVKKKIKYDVVTCLGTFPIFTNPKIILNNLINLVAKKGVLIIDGRFNKHKISAKIVYNDHSVNLSKNIWRCDFNLHSEEIIKKIILSRSDIKSFEFKYPIMDTKISKKQNMPDINVWTLPRKKGGYDIVNGLNIFINPSFLIIEKK